MSAFSINYLFNAYKWCAFLAMENGTTIVAGVNLLRKGMCCYEKTYRTMGEDVFFLLEFTAKG